MQKIHLLTIAVALWLISCDGSEDTPIVATGIEVSPTELSINDGDDTQITLTTTPGGLASYQLFDSPSWLSVSPDSGSVNKSLAITITANGEGLEPDTYTETLLFASTAGNAQVQVSMTVAPNPLVGLDATTLEYADGVTSQTFTITNTGVGALNYTLSSDIDFLSFDNDNGNLATGTSSEVVVTADRYLIAAGTYTGTITVASNAAHGDKTIGVTVVVPEIATVTASTDTTGFNYFIDALEVTIQNDGNVTYDYTATSGNNLFAISNASGSLQMGENITLTLTAQRDGLATGTHSDILTITNSKGENTQVAIGLLNFVEEKWLIDNAGFTDAVYDINQDVIVAVYRTDFHVIDPVAETISTLILPESANCVAISPDGTKAVVGHNHYVTHIDMTTKTILNTFYLGSNLIYTYDIELSNDDFAYVVPSSSRYAQNLYKINLQNGNASGVSTGTSWAYNIVAQLHPSGNYVYTTQDDTAPVPMRKYDVSKGNPSFMYTIQNGYSDGGNMWMSTTGDYIFTAYGNVFATTTDATTDLNELGDLTADVISQMDHSAAANKVYTLEYGSGVYEHEMTMVRTYDASTFSHVETIKLPSYILKDDEGGGKVNDAYGLFGFFNSTGTKYYVMAKDAETRSSFSIIEIAVN